MPTLKMSFKSGGAGGQDGGAQIGRQDARRGPVRVVQGWACWMSLSVQLCAFVGDFIRGVGSAAGREEGGAEQGG
jgi:hypothetical protein